ncbi:murein L,D-transpeptidase, partial [Neisseria sp. P0001.S004]
MKRILLGIALAAGLNSLAAADAVSDYIQRKKVVVNTAKAELCFADDGQCHPVLIG